MSEKVTLVLDVEGAKKRRVPFVKNAGFEALKLMIGREYATKSIVEIGYLSDGDLFAIAGDDSLEGYLQENPLPPLKITLSSMPMTAAPPTISTLTPTGPSTAVTGISAPPPQAQSNLPTETTRAEAAIGPATAAAHSAPAAPTPAPPIPGADDMVKPTAKKPPSTPPLEPLPPLAMCTLRLEAAGMPPQTVEIDPEEAEDMGLLDFMKLMAVRFEGRIVTGAPAIGASSGDVTGLVDSAKTVRAVMRASRVHPVVLLVPLLPLRPQPPQPSQPSQPSQPPPADKAERKKLKKKQKPKEQRRTAESQPAEGAAAPPGRGQASAPPRGGPPDPARLKALVSRLSAPVDTLLADPNATTAFLYEIGHLIREDEKTAALLGQAGIVAPLVKLLDVRTNLPPEVAGLVLVAIACLSMDPGNRTAFGRAGVAATLVGLLGTGLPATGPPRLAEVLLRTVAILADHDPQNKASLERAGIAPSLVGLLSAHPDLLTATPGVAEQLFMAIGNIADDPKHGAAFGRAGVAAPLARMLIANPNLPTTCPGAAEQFLGALANLSMVPEIRTAFERAGVAAPLVRLLSGNPSAGISEKLLLTIANLSADQANKTALWRARVVAPLVGLLTSRPNGLVFDAMANLSVDPEIGAAFGRAGVAAPLVRLLNAFPDLPFTAPAVAEELLATVANLSTDAENRTSLGRAGAVTPLIRLLTHGELFTTQPGVAERLLLSIANLSGDSENSIAFGRAGVAAPLVGLLAHPNLPALSEHLFRAIANLSAEPKNLPAFVSAGVVGPLVRLLPHMPIANTVVAEQLLRVIFMLSNDPGCRAAFGNVRPVLQRLLIRGVDPDLVSAVMDLFAHHHEAAASTSVKIASAPVPPREELPMLPAEEIAELRWLVNSELPEEPVNTATIPLVEFRSRRVTVRPIIIAVAVVCLVDVVFAQTELNGTSFHDHNLSSSHNAAPYTSSFITYSWNEIYGASGTSSLSMSDDTYQTLTLPFSFPFFGTYFSQVALSSNGFLTFDTSEQAKYTNAQIPKSGQPHYLIALLWLDLHPGNGGQVLVSSTSQRLIVEWRNVPLYGDSTLTLLYTIQMVIYPTGRIDYRYKTIPDRADGTVGIENGDGDGKAISIIPALDLRQTLTGDQRAGQAMGSQIQFAGGLACSAGVAASAVQLLVDGAAPAGLTWGCSGTKFVASFTAPTVAGTHVLRVTATSDATATGTWNFNVGPAAASAAKCDFSGATTMVAGSSYTLTVTGTDPYGNSVLCQSPTQAAGIFTVVWAGAAIGSPTWSCTASSCYKAVFTPGTTTVGRYTADLTVSGVAQTKQTAIPVDVTAAAASPAKCVFSGATTMVAGSSYTLTVTGTDPYGNSVPCQSPTQAASIFTVVWAGAAVASPTWSCTAATPARYQAVFTPGTTTVGTYTADLVVYGTAQTSQPAINVAVTAGLQDCGHLFDRIGKAVIIT
ncbi:hypothetical protein PAPYR_4499 [Paratrimastix pyriformis]|uniref:Uncharacterized protein n=1 Tax=Paratrimastix pyriformis TaxID=342808 RepID=A0ABQ8UME7_9EUKA|nr:hypothetical protein PAPYR_4499 [Paratrimastix pyriformis]